MAKLADDIVVGVKGDKVDMVIKKSSLNLHATLCVDMIEAIFTQVWGG